MDRARRIATSQSRIAFLFWPLVAIGLFVLWEVHGSWVDPRPWYSATWNRLNASYQLALALACFALALAERSPAKRRRTRAVLRLASLVFLLGGVFLFFTWQRVGLAEH